MEAMLKELFTIPLVRAGVILVGSLLVALILHLVLTRWLGYLTRKTKTDLDDRFVEALKRPVFISVLLAGIAYASQQFTLKPYPTFIIMGVLKTVAVVLWSVAGARMGSAILEGLSRHSGKVKLIQPRTLPLFDILVKMLVVGGAVYFALLAWDIDVTGWLASAGIVGIAVGFAAKDTLANLVAGFFIVADAPYKIGDYIQLDSGLRGKVTEIGFRSTRILTRDDIEITVPNAVIGNTKIINEAGGPHEMRRVRIKVSVAYGSDVDQVRDLLMQCVKGAEHVVAYPAPRVRFRRFGDSGLEFELLLWIEEPWARGKVTDELNTRVYKTFNEAGVEIPYSKHDVYIKQMPGQPEQPEQGSGDQG
jgi:small-conductance mechanosensitive channel